MKPVVAILLCCAVISQVAASRSQKSPQSSKTIVPNTNRRIFRRGLMDMPMDMANAGADMFSGAADTMAEGAKEMVSMGTDAMSGAMDQMSGMGPPMGGPMDGGPMGPPPKGPPGHRPHHQRYH